MTDQPRDGTPCAIQWIGTMPSHWSCRRLKHVASVALSSVDKKSHQQEEAVRLCNYVDVYHNERITSELDFMQATATLDEVRRFTLRSGDVLITKDSEAWDDIAVPAHVPADLEGVLCGYHLAQVRPHNGLIDGAFLSWSFAARGINDQFRIEAAGITRYGLSKHSIDNALFLVPPLDEQRAIARFLDRETARIDALIEKKRRQIELLHEKRAALISQAVTKGLDPNAPVKDSGIEWLGEIPAHWDVLGLKRICRLVYGDALASDGRVDGDVPVYGSNGPVGTHIHSNTVAPCIVVGRKGSFGKVQYSEAPVFAIDTTYYVDERFSKAALRWLYYALIWVRLDDVSKDSAVPGLDREDAYARRLPTPPLDEQRAIAAFLDRETARIDALVEKVNLSIDRLREYRTALISAAVTGKIDVRKEVA